MFGAAVDQSINIVATGPALYVASRASLDGVPDILDDLPALWRHYRQKGWNIVSSWIDLQERVADEDIQDRWKRIHQEIGICDGLILYAYGGSLPVNSALIEAGIAIGMGKTVVIVSEEDGLHGTQPYPIGSWIALGQCRVLSTIELARTWIASEAEANAGQSGTDACGQGKILELFQEIRDRLTVVSNRLKDGGLEAGELQGGGLVQELLDQGTETDRRIDEAIDHQLSMLEREWSRAAENMSNLNELNHYLSLCYDYMKSLKLLHEARKGS